MAIGIVGTAALAAISGLPAMAAAGPRAGIAAVQVSADPYLNPAVQHATEVEPDTIAVGHTVMSVFQVGRWDNGCADNMGWAMSTDGGRNWQHGYMPGLTRFSTPPGPFVRASDPVIAYDALFGEWIASALDCNGTSPNPNASVPSPSVSVNISSDGVHWSKAVVVAHIKKGQDFDKDWITCDNSLASRYFGNCYVEWDIDTADDRVVMSTSTDGGFHWSAPAATAGDLHGIGGEPIVQPDGTVVVPIQGFIGQQVDLVAFRSTNGGRTWGKTTVVTPIVQRAFPGDLRGSTFQSVAEDASGRIYVTWADCRFRPDCTTNDMVLTTSTDGVHWTPVVRIPIDPVTSVVDHLGGGLGIDPTTSGTHARLGLFYNFYPNATCTVASCQLYEGYVSSTDGGRHWSAPQVVAGPMKLTELVFSSGYMVGDYEGTAIVPGGNAYSAFAVGGIPSGGQRLNEAMYEPTGGAPVIGGTRPASAAGVRVHLSAEHPSALARCSCGISPLALNIRKLS
jgi:BNR repeat-like domain